MTEWFTTTTLELRDLPGMLRLPEGRPIKVLLNHDYQHPIGRLLVNRVTYTHGVGIGRIHARIESPRADREQVEEALHACAPTEDGLAWVVEYGGLREDDNTLRLHEVSLAPAGLREPAVPAQGAPQTAPGWDVRVGDHAGAPIHWHRTDVPAEACPWCQPRVNRDEPVLRDYLAAGPGSAALRDYWTTGPGSEPITGWVECAVTGGSHVFPLRTKRDADKQWERVCTACGDMFVADGPQGPWLRKTVRAKVVEDQHGIRPAPGHKVVGEYPPGTSTGDQFVHERAAAYRGVTEHVLRGGGEQPFGAKPVARNYPVRDHEHEFTRLDGTRDYWTAPGVMVRACARIYPEPCGLVQYARMGEDGPSDWMSKDEWDALRPEEETMPETMTVYEEDERFATMAPSGRVRRYTVRNGIPIADIIDIDPEALIKGARTLWRLLAGDKSKTETWADLGDRVRAAAAGGAERASRPGGSDDYGPTEPKSEPEADEAPERLTDPEWRNLMAGVRVQRMAGTKARYPGSLDDWVWIEVYDASGHAVEDGYVQRVGRPYRPEGMRGDGPRTHGVEMSDEDVAGIGPENAGIGRAPHYMDDVPRPGATGTRNLISALRARLQNPGRFTPRGAMTERIGSGQENKAEWRLRAIWPVLTAIDINARAHARRVLVTAATDEIASRCLAEHKPVNSTLCDCCAQATRAVLDVAQTLAGEGRL